MTEHSKYYYDYERNIDTSKPVKEKIDVPSYYIGNNG